MSEPSLKTASEPEVPVALNEGRYAERLWGYKDQVGSYSEMGRLYERDRAEFWKARYEESNAVETATPKSKFDLAFEILRQLEAEGMDLMRSCHFGYVLTVRRQKSPEES